MSDPNAPEDREHFGEASLGEAQADTEFDPLDPDEDKRAADAEELTDVPALEPAPADAAVDEAAEEAAAEAGAIGGVTGQERLSDEERPLVEAGEGVAEGFEESEADLIEAASHGDPAGNPLEDRGQAEESRPEGATEYGEADREYSSEDTADDH